MDPRITSRYRIEKALGKGSMGCVYLAHDRQLGRLVALKVLTRAAADNLEGLARFRREARLQAAVAHPYLLGILDIHLDGPEPVLVLEYVEGRSLHRRLREAGPLPLPGVVRLAVELGGALDAMHGVGILHRDIKPGNVLVRAEDGAAILMDLGLARAGDDARLTRTGLVMGTPVHMPPEVLRKGLWSEAGDLYGLGTVLVEACGWRPEGTEVMDAALVRRVDEGLWRIPEEVGLPAPVATALRRAVDPDASRRPASGAELAEELRAALAGEAAPRKSSRSPVGGDRASPDRGGPSRPDTPGMTRGAVPPAPSRTTGRGPWLGPAVVLLVAGLGIFAMLGGGSGGPGDAPAGNPSPAPWGRELRRDAGPGVLLEVREECVARWQDGDGPWLVLAPGTRRLPGPPAGASLWTLDGLVGARRAVTRWPVEGLERPGNSVLPED